MWNYDCCAAWPFVSVCSLWTWPSTPQTKHRMKNVLFKAFSVSSVNVIKAVHFSFNLCCWRKIFFLTNVYVLIIFLSCSYCCLFQRYYGKSLPFGKESFNIPQVGLLTVEQALADYAVMIRELKEQLAASHCPVIVFGGRWDLQL